MLSSVFIKGKTSCVLEITSSIKSYLLSSQKLKKKILLHGFLSPKTISLFYNWNCFERNKTLNILYKTKYSDKIEKFIYWINKNDSLLQEIFQNYILFYQNIARLLILVIFLIYKKFSRGFIRKNTVPEICVHLFNTSWIRHSITLYIFTPKQLFPR